MLPDEFFDMPVTVDTRLGRIRDAIRAKLNGEGEHREWLLKARPMQQAKRAK
jgi:hypothetical protein